MHKFLTALIAIACASPLAHAILVIGDDATYAAAPANLTGWNSVGRKGVGSAVYLGNGWVITANHVGFGDVTLNGTSYSGDASTFHRLIQPGATNNGNPVYTDLVMFKLTSDPGLPRLTVASSAPTAGTSVTMVGQGDYKLGSQLKYTVNKATDTSGNPVWTWTSDPNGTTIGYDTSTYEPRRRWGTNTISNFNYTTSNYVRQAFALGDATTTYFATIYGGTAGEGQGINGDSGGAVFNSAGTLIGIIGAIGNFPSQPANTVFADPSTTVNLNYPSDLVNQITLVMDLSVYYPQINFYLNSSPVPEPTTLFALGSTALITQRPRRQAHRLFAPTK